MEHNVNISVEAIKLTITVVTFLFAIVYFVQKQKAIHKAETEKQKKEADEREEKQKEDAEKREEIIFAKISKSKNEAIEHADSTMANSEKVMILKMELVKKDVAHVGEDIMGLASSIKGLKEDNEKRFGEVTALLIAIKKAE